MGIDLMTKPALGSVKFATNINRGVPILLQATSTTLETRALHQAPQLYKAVEKIVGYSGALSSGYTDYELGENDFKWWK
jgi:hypothetical protein